MSLNIQEDTERILGRKYNVEYKVNNAFKGGEL